METMSVFNYLEAIKELHKMFGSYIPKAPRLCNRKVVATMNRLILEELSKYNKAVAKNDIVEIADALGGLLVVVFGTAVQHGIPMDKVFASIHTSNMSKKGGYKDAGGKFIKPDSYKPVDLSYIGEMCLGVS